MAAQPPILTRDFALLTVAHALQALGWSSMLLLPLYLDWLGASRTEVGSVMAAAAIGGLGARPLVGWSLDRLGRKFTLVTGTVFIVVGIGLLGLVEQIGVVVYVARVVMGVGMGAGFTGYFTTAADLVPEARRTEGLALFGISGLLPLAMNPVAGRLGMEGPELRTFFLGVAVFIAASLLFLLPIRPTDGGPRPDVSLAEALDALRSRRLWPVWVGTVVFSGLVAVFMAFATVAAAARGMEDPALLWLTYAGGAVAVRGIGATLPARLGPSRVLAGALSLYVAGTVVLAFAASPAAFALVGLLAGIGHGYAFPVLAGQVVTRAPASLRGSAMATYTALWDAGKLVLVPIFGALADASGDAVMFLVAAAGAGVGLALWALLESRTLHPAPA